MAEIGPKLLQWMDSFQSIDCLNFKGFGLDLLFFYKQREINSPFLHPATSLWDLHAHVFHFKYEEMCPTVNEFAAIMGHTHRDDIAVCLCV